MRNELIKFILAVIVRAGEGGGNPLWGETLLWKKKGKRKKKTETVIIRENEFSKRASL